MVVTAFPKVEDADSSGLLCIGGDLDLETILLAYRSGIFPWPLDDETLAWFAPPRRCILRLDEFHVSRSLEKLRRRGELQVTHNRDFPGVIAACSEVVNRGSQGGTWITPWLIDAYIELHRAGYAESFECYEDSTLVGGIYGVCIGGFFAGESMFYRKDNASKLALWFCVEELTRRGLSWIDCQVKNPHLMRLGAVEISRSRYMKLLAEVFSISANKS